MTWHASLLQNLVERRQLPEMDIAHRLSDLNQKQWQTQRRQNQLEAKERMQQGASLARQRDYKKRRVDQMSFEEQHILTDFETEESKKHYEQTRVKKPQYDWNKIWL